MTPLHFEAAYSPLWQELEDVLASLQGRSKFRLLPRRRPAVDAARLASLYRRSCEHLALARARAYPIHLTDRLEALTHRAHQAIYRRQGHGLADLKHGLLIGLPQAVRAHRAYMAVATAVFVLTTLAMGVACYLDPGFSLSLLHADQVRSYGSMYGDEAVAIGREAGGDWQMFGYYIMNNISVAFQCFASGLFLGVGSLFYLAFNGLLGGAVAGYLTARGYGEAFYSFVVTHAAFELTAIVIAGAAGLRLGHSLLAPGRLTRLQALQHAARETSVLLYGVVGMLVIAAAVEAFWSSARWVTPAVKYGAGAACWALVIGYLGWQGRHAR
jgi:uncharacterized membrane protein SpoIIM required for sporulation